MQQHDQARRRPERTDRRDHQSFREEGQLLLSIFLFVIQSGAILLTAPISLGPRRILLKLQGFKLQSLKLYTPTRALLEAHYADLSSKGFFAGMITTMMSGPVCCMVWEGLGAVATGRVVSQNLPIVSS